MGFQQFNLDQRLIRAVSEMGYDTPTEIQLKAIPAVLEGRDVMGCAQTGTGKTAAFTLPILETIKERSSRKIRIKSLILTPTRELALQINENIRSYTKYLPLRSTVIYGGASQKKQVDSLRKGVDIVVATPGRLLDLMGQGFVNMNALEVLVLDEADTMLDMGFIRDINKIIKQLPKNKQTLFFSATMPKSIQKLSKEILRNPVKIFVQPQSTAAETVKQSVYFVDQSEKTKLLLDLLKGNEINQALVFTRTKRGADKLTKQLSRNGIKTGAIHGDKSQSKRQGTLLDFKKHKINVLVATDVASRGIDIDELPHVINYNLPNVPEIYVHRIGRTGRAGNEGIAISFCDKQEMKDFKNIQKLIGNKMIVNN